MSDLVEVCAVLGYKDAETILASGNVVFGTDAIAPDVETALEVGLARTGLVTDVLVRGSAELERAIASNPFRVAAADHPSHVTITFHRHPFPPEALDRLRAFHNGPEQIAAVERELFVDYGGRDGMRASTL